MVLGDFNGDGQIDVVFGTLFGDTLYLSLGNGNGTFQAASQVVTGSYITSPAATGDFNGDGKLDLVATVVTLGATAEILVLLGNGDGTFQTSVINVIGDDADDVTVADFNGDGKLDLAVTNYCPTGLGCNSGDDIGSVTILLGNGDGTFYLRDNFSSGEFPTGGVAADFNDDGIVDLAVINTEAVQVFFGKGDGTFPRYVLYPGGRGPSSLAAGTFTHDRQTDLIVGAYDNTVAYLKGKGDGTFVDARDFEPGGFNPLWVTTGDFNHDGEPDLAVVNNCVQINACSHGVVSILLGKGNGSFKPGVSYGVSIFPQAAITGDFNGDGNLDLAVTADCKLGGPCDYNVGVVSILLGKGDGSFQTAVEYDVGSYPLSLTSGDFNRDGKLDLAVSNQDGADVTVLLGNGDGTFQAGVTFPTDISPVAIVSGDFNGDGKLDLVTAGYSGTVSLLLGNGDGTFQPPLDFPVAQITTALAVADLNGDGKLDLVVTGGCDFFSEADTVSVLLGNGDGTFKPAVSYAVGSCPSSVTIADFSGNGKLDIVVADGGQFLNHIDTGNVALLYGRGDGSFEHPISGPVADPLVVTHADFNLDGAEDLAGIDSGGYVRVALHKGQR